MTSDHLQAKTSMPFRQYHAFLVYIEVNFSTDMSNQISMRLQPCYKQNYSIRPTEMLTVSFLAWDDVIEVSRLIDIQRHGISVSNCTALKTDTLNLPPPNT
jgi:hypothetical protein